MSLHTNAGYKEKLEEMQDLTFDCYRTDPELFSVIDSLVRTCELLTDASPETSINNQLQIAYNGLMKYRSERMSKIEF